MKILSWVIWISQTYIMAIIMLNFLIAFVTQAYEEVVTKQSQSQYQHKCEMNLQLAQYIDYFEKQNKAEQKSWWIKLWLVQKLIGWVFKGSDPVLLHYLFSVDESVTTDDEWRGNVGSIQKQIRKETDFVKVKITKLSKLYDKIEEA